MKALVKAKAEPGWWLQEIPEPGFGPADVLDHTSHGAKVLLLGIFPETVAIDWDKVIFKGLVLKGICGREMFETWYKMSSMIRAGLDIAPVITHRFHHTEFAKAQKPSK